VVNGSRFKRGIQLTQEKRKWSHLTQVGIGLVGVIVGVLLSAYITHSYYVPVLTYQKFQPYKLSDKEQITMIIVANEGRSVATNLRIIIEATGEVKDYRIDSIEETIPTRDTNTLTLESKRLLQGMKREVCIRILATELDPIRKISVMSDQVVGEEKIVQSAQGDIPAILVLLVIVLILILFVVYDRTQRRSLDLANKRWYDSYSKQIEASRGLRLIQGELNRTKAQLQKANKELRKYTSDFDQIVIERDELKKRLAKSSS